MTSSIIVLLAKQYWALSRYVSLSSDLMLIVIHDYWCIVLALSFHQNGSVLVCWTVTGSFPLTFRCSSQMVYFFYLITILKKKNCSSVYLSTNYSIRLNTNIVSIAEISLSLSLCSLSLSLKHSLSLFLPLSLRFCLFFHMFLLSHSIPSTLFSLFGYIYLCVSVCLTLCLSLSVCLSVWLSVSLSLSLSISLSASLYFKSDVSVLYSQEVYTPLY